MNRASTKPRVEKVEFPADILGNMDSQVSVGQGSIRESLDIISGALAARDLTFPCIKKTLWDDQFVIRTKLKTTQKAA